MFCLSLLLLLGSSLLLTGCTDPCAEDLATRDFLRRAAAEKGAVQTESGLIYQELKPGYGPSPGPRDRVTAHYRGTLADGTVFDSSYERGQPASFSLKSVIPGWVEGLQKMKGGGSTRLVIPPHLGYGKKGKPPKIPPCAVLVFEIELLGIQGP